MPTLALVAVLLAACTHALWNLAAKQAAAARHFVFWYSVVSMLLYLPALLWVLQRGLPDLDTRHWLALSATSVLHMGYSLTLQAGYRHADLSLVYPLARGSGPLLSFVLAVLLLGETPAPGSVLGMLLIVAGILLVTGLLAGGRRIDRKGVAYGLCTGGFIAAYTINDGWAVKTLLLSPLLVDYTGNLFRTAVLSPAAWREWPEAREELRQFLRPVLTVSLLGPLGYILVLYAMQTAPVSHVAAARELSTLAGAWLGACLLKERFATSRLLGAAAIVGGVVLLSLPD